MAYRWIRIKVGRFDPIASHVAFPNYGRSANANDALDENHKQGTQRHSGLNDVGPDDRFEATLWE